MARNAGSKCCLPSSKDPALPLTSSHSKLDSTIKAILRKKVFECLDIEKSHASLLARIKLLEKHAADSMIPSSLQILCIKAKGQGTEALHAKFDNIICDAELKLLDTGTDSLCTDVEAHREAF